MSAWRRRAIETCPDLQPEFEKPNATVYDVFFELLPRVRKAHARGDIEALRRIYAFAEWCMRQNEEELWNAAGVAFYEHLVDHANTLSEISRWVSPEVFKAVCPLFRARLDRVAYQTLCDAFAQRHGPIEEPARPPSDPDNWSI